MSLTLSKKIRHAEDDSSHDHLYQIRHAKDNTSQDHLYQIRTRLNGSKSNVDEKASFTRP